MQIQAIGAAAVALALLCAGTAHGQDKPQAQTGPMQELFTGDAKLIGAVPLDKFVGGSNAVVVDGDTIKLGGATYRLWGIDAPESKQSCAGGWPAGVESTRKLEEMVKGRAVECEYRDRDRYGRTVALCRAGGADIGAEMVRAGMAWAFTRYSSDYIAEEKAAVAARAGVHAHDCEKAWEWRQKKR